MTDPVAHSDEMSSVGASRPVRQETGEQDGDSSIDAVRKLLTNYGIWESTAIELAPKLRDIGEVRQTLKRISRQAAAGGQRRDPCACAVAALRRHIAKAGNSMPSPDKSAIGKPSPAQRIDLDEARKFVEQLRMPGRRASRERILPRLSRVERDELEPLDSETAQWKERLARWLQRNGCLP